MVIDLTGSLHHHVHNDPFSSVVVVVMVVLVLSRKAKESGGDVPVADCVEEECSADEVEQEAGLFASYMASR